MKKLITLLIATAMLASLSACGSEEKESSKEESVIETTKREIEERYSLDTVYDYHDISFSVYSGWENSDSYSYSDRIVLTCPTAEAILTMSFNEYDTKEVCDKMFKFHEDTYNKLGSTIPENINVDSINISKFSRQQSDGYENSYMFEYKNCIYKIEFYVSTEHLEDCKMFQNSDEIIQSIKFSDIETTINNIDDNEAKEPTEKEKIRAYQNGMFKVGTDIEAGEYMLFATSTSGYLCVSSDANQDDIIFNENFGNNLIATFEDGEYIELSRCMAVPYDPIPGDITDLIKDKIDDGAMYKVGKNIEAGEYKLECTSDISGYYCVYSDSRHDDIIANDNFDNNTYVNVSDGEYLLLSRCKIVK